MTHRSVEAAAAAAMVAGVQLCCICVFCLKWMHTCCHSATCNDACQLTYARPPERGFSKLPPWYVDGNIAQTRGYVFSSLTHWHFAITTPLCSWRRRISAVCTMASRIALWWLNRFCFWFVVFFLRRKAHIHMYQYKFHKTLKEANP